MIAHKKVFSPVIDEEWQKTQCVPRETCVEVAKELGTTTNKFFKPPCVNVFRCGGCCNEESLSCMNTSTTYVSKTVNEPIYMHSLCPGSQRREGKEDVWFLKSCYERSVCSVITNRRMDFFYLCGVNTGMCNDILHSCCIIKNVYICVEMENQVLRK